MIYIAPWCEDVISYLMATGLGFGLLYFSVCSISHHLQDICKSNKMQNFDLENEGQGQGEKRDLHHSTGGDQ